MELEALTIQFPVTLLKQAKQLKNGGESFNELVVEAVEREVKRRRAIVCFLPFKDCFLGEN